MGLPPVLTRHAMGGRGRFVRAPTRCSENEECIAESCANAPPRCTPHIPTAPNPHHTPHIPTASFPQAEPCNVRRRAQPWMWSQS